MSTSGRSEPSLELTRLTPVSNRLMIFLAGPISHWKKIFSSSWGLFALINNLKLACEIITDKKQLKYMDLLNDLINNRFFIDWEQLSTPSQGIIDCAYRTKFMICII